MLGRIIGINRRGEANAIVRGIANRLFVKPGKIAEYLDEFVADGFCFLKEKFKVTVELRLPPR